MRIWSILLLHLVEKIQADKKDILMQNSGQLGEIEGCNRCIIDILTFSAFFSMFFRGFCYL